MSQPLPPHCRSRFASMKAVQNECSSQSRMKEMTNPSVHMFGVCGTGLGMPICVCASRLNTRNG